MYNITISKAHTLIDAFTESVLLALSEGRSIELLGFGSFKAKKVKERNGRNPKTGNPIVIPAKNSPVFRAGKKLKDAVN